MKTLIQEAGASFLRAFLAAMVVLVPGILAAPNVHEGTAMAWAASASALIAGLRAIQVFVPKLSVGYLITQTVGLANKQWEELEDSFVRAFLGTFIAMIGGVLAAPDFGTAKSLGIAAVVGAFTAAFRALEGIFTPGEVPSLKQGFKRKPPAQARYEA